jgi:hypothetical protein
MFLRSQRRRDLILFLVGAGALVTLFAIDHFVESPREETTRKIKEMASASKARNIGDITKHMAESFYYNGRNKSETRELFNRILENTNFGGVDVTAFSRDEFQEIDDKTAKVRFEVWPTGFGLPEFRYSCWATFVKEPDGQFRLKTFDLYQGAGDKPVIPPQL